MGKWREMTTFVVAGVVKDVSRTIEIDISRFSKIFEPLGALKFILVESNSVDNSLETLQTLSTKNKNIKFVSLGKSNPALLRTERIAEARNRYLDYVLNHPEYRSADYLVVCDFNNLNKLLTTEAIRNSLLDHDWDVCTANQSTKYYDIWALRHAIWSPNDCWQQHSFYRDFGLSPNASLKAAIHSRMLHIPKDSPNIEVESAFGGFAIYRMMCVGNARYVGSDQLGKPICEHVPFHQELRKAGRKIIIDPGLINAGWVDHTNETRFYRNFVRLANYPLKWVKKKFRF